MAGEATPGSQYPQLPSGNIVDPVWIRTDGSAPGLANRTFLNKGYGPYSFMLEEDLPKLVATGDANWQSWFGKNRTMWPFNTECCATGTYYQQAFCDDRG